MPLKVSTHPKWRLPPTTLKINIRFGMMAIVCLTVCITIQRDGGVHLNGVVFFGMMGGKLEQARSTPLHSKNLHRFSNRDLLSAPAGNQSPNDPDFIGQC